MSIIYVCISDTTCYCVWSHRTWIWTSCAVITQAERNKAQNRMKLLQSVSFRSVPFHSIRFRSPKESLFATIQKHSQHFVLFYLLIANWKMSLVIGAMANLQYILFIVVFLSCEWIGVRKCDFFLFYRCLAFWKSNLVHRQMMMMMKHHIASQINRV